MFFPKSQCIFTYSLRVVIVNNLMGFILPRPFEQGNLAPNPVPLLIPNPTPFINPYPPTLRIHQLYPSITTLHPHTYIVCNINPHHPRIIYPVIIFIPYHPHLWDPSLNPPILSIPTLIPGLLPISNLTLIFIIAIHSTFPRRHPRIDTLDSTQLTHHSIIEVPLIIEAILIIEVHLIIEVILIIEAILKIEAPINIGAAMIIKFHLIIEILCNNKGITVDGIIINREVDRVSIRIMLLIKPHF